MDKQYRPCAGIVVFNNKGKVLLCRRKGIEGAFQFPQGGIEDNETIEDAARRELYEETGIKNVILVSQESEPICYDFSEEVRNAFLKKGIFNRGQKIYFSLYFFSGNDEEIDFELFEPEFDEYRWENFDFAIEHIIAFKKDVYKLIALKFMPLIEQYLGTKS